MIWAIEEVDYWLNSRQLCLEPAKTEAVLLIPRRNISPVTSLVQGVSITPQKSLKYLGVRLDTNLNFAEHIRKASVKIDKTVAVLRRLMPNVGGPRSSKRPLLASVAYSISLYAAPIWIDALQIQRTRRTIESMFRELAIQVCQAYRTISLDAVMVITGMLPFDLMAKERAERYEENSTEFNDKHIFGPSSLDFRKNTNQLRKHVSGEKTTRKHETSGKTHENTGGKHVKTRENTKHGETSGTS
nr:unnamed protein product [Callosobruchus analis]